MKRFVVVIFVWVVFFCSSIFCMQDSPEEKVVIINNSRPLNQLLVNKAKLLKDHLAIETSGKFSSELFEAEKILHTYFDDISQCRARLEDANLVKNSDKETMRLAKLIAQRIDDRESSLIAINRGDALALQKIIKANPHMLNAYWPKEEKYSKQDLAGKNLLHQAVILEKIDCIKKLLELKANCNCVADPSGRSALHYAVDQDRHITIVESLLEVGADLEISDCSGKIPFDIACGINSSSVQAFEKYGYLFFSSIWPYKNPFLLLNNDGKYLKELVNEPIGSREWESASNSLDRLFVYLESNKLPPSLVESGIFIKEKGFVLRYASKQDCEKYFGKQMLLDAQELTSKKRKIYVNLLYSIAGNGTNALESILKDCVVSSSLQYEMLKICIGNDDMPCLRLCLDKGFNPNSYHKKISLLHYAVQCNRPEAIKILEDYRPDLAICYDFEKKIVNNIDGSTFQAMTPLDYAVELKHQKCIDLLVDVIKKRQLELLSINNNNYWCGLVKHMNMNASKSDKPKKRGCEKCRVELGQQLKLHITMASQYTH